MARHIDADEILSYIARIENSGLGKKKSLEYISKYIENQSTIYDIDQVVEQLEAASYRTETTFDEDGYSNDDSDEVVLLDKAVEIVTAGFLNDNKEKI